MNYTRYTDEELIVIGLWEDVDSLEFELAERLDRLIEEVED